MALQNTIVMGVHSGAVAAGTILRIVPPGVVQTLTTNENCQDAPVQNYWAARSIFVADGNVYIPKSRTAASAPSFLAYNPRLSKFQYELNLGTSVRAVIGPNMPIVGLHGWQSSTSPRTSDGGYGTEVIPTQDYQVFEGDAYFAGGEIWKMAAPFTSAPIQYLEDKSIIRLLAYNGNLYAFSLLGNALVTYRLSGSSFTEVGSCTTEQTGTLKSSQLSVFEYGDKVWALICFPAPGIGGSQKVRCYEINTSTGGCTEHNEYVPAAWKVAGNSLDLFEIIDDTGSSRQVFIVRHEQAGGWEMYEFLESTWQSVVSGAHSLTPKAGMVWDADAHGAHVISATDIAPREYAELSIRTFDIESNGNVAIDPRYEFLDDPYGSPPNHACTEKPGAGSEGKSGLTTKPAGFANLTDLSDDFSGDSINSNLWERAYPAIDPGTADYGCFRDDVPRVHSVEQTGGNLVFGASVYVGSVVWNGIGVKGRWGITGAFQVDVTVTNTAGLLPDNAKTNRLLIAVKAGTNHGYGIYVYRTGAGVGKAIGTSFSENLAPSQSADSANNVTDGSVLRISRNAANVWSLRLNPTGPNEDLLPAVKPNYSEEVQIWLGIVANGSVYNWGGVSPGFSDLDVSGAGALNRYEGGVSHVFHWDYEIDLVCGDADRFQLLVDTKS